MSYKTGPENAGWFSAAGRSRPWHANSYAFCDWISTPAALQHTPYHCQSHALQSRTCTSLLLSCDSAAYRRITTGEHRGSPLLSRWQTNDKSGWFYRPILSIEFLGKIRTSSAAKFIAEIPADKIGRMKYKSRPILCRPIKSANFIVRLSSALRSVPPIV